MIVDVEFYRLLTLRSALKLEILGMSRRGQSVYALIKEEFGFKGNKKKVYSQLDELIKKKKEKNHGND